MPRCLGAKCGAPTDAFRTDTFREPEDWTNAEGDGQQNICGRCRGEFSWSAGWGGNAAEVPAHRDWCIHVQRSSFQSKCSDDTDDLVRQLPLKIGANVKFAKPVQIAGYLHGLRVFCVSNRGFLRQ